MIAGSPLISQMALYSPNISSVVTRILFWSNNAVDSPARRNTATGGTPSSSSRFTSVPETRKRLVMPESPQRRHIDHKPVLHIALEEPFVCLVDLLNSDEFNVGRDAFVGAEIQHLLRLANAADR